MNVAVLIAGGGIHFNWAKADSGSVETTVFFGAVLLVVVLIFIWATFWRKTRRHHHSHHHSQISAGTPTVALPRQHKHRPRFFRMLRGHNRPRRRRHVRPANPTLAQSGGLPPARQQPPSSS